MYVKVIGSDHHEAAKRLIGQTLKAFAKVESTSNGKFVYLVENPEYDQAANLLAGDRNPYWKVVWQDPSYIPIEDENTALVGYMWLFANSEAEEVNPRNNIEAKILLKR